MSPRSIKVPKNHPRKATLIGCRDLEVGPFATDEFFHHETDYETGWAITYDPRTDTIFSFYFAVIDDCDLEDFDA